MHTKFWPENLTRNDHLKEASVSGNVNISVDLKEI
jgi:hypothetical protein